MLAVDDTISWLTSIEFMGDNLIVGADNFYNILVMKWDVTESLLKRVGHIHIGDMINHLQKGVVRKRFPCSKTSDFPTVFFGTTSGSIGVITSLPHNLHEFSKMLEQCMINLKLGTDGMILEDCRSNPTNKIRVPRRNFVDGDILLPVLSDENTLKLVSQTMNIPSEDIYEKVLELTGLHSINVLNI